MKALDLWAGTEYAWCDDRPKGVETPRGCVRVKVIKVFQKKDYYSERARTLVAVEVIEDRNKYPRFAPGKHLEVRARDIVDFWDEYEERLEVLTAEERRVEQERVAERDKQEALASAIADALAMRGLPRDKVFVDYSFVRIPVGVVRDWLGLEERREAV